MGGFKAFLLKTNALALAIGVIIGAALGTVVNSLVNDIIMPPIGYALGGVDFDQLKIVLKAANPATDPTTEVAIRYGAFINSIITFVDRGARRLLDRQDVHQGGPGRRGEDLPVLRGAERPGRRPSAGPAPARSDRSGVRRSGSCRGRGASS